jgi:hypothetical protein
VILTLVLLVTFAPSGLALAATNFVIGDSNSLDGIGGTTSWVEEAFGDNVVNRAKGAASTYLYLNSCRDTCWWVADVGPDDTFWIMLGTADPRFDPDTTPQVYVDHMRTIFALIPANDIRLISSPRVNPLLTELNAVLDQQAFIDPLLCDENPRVTCAPNPRDYLKFPLHYRDPVHLNDEGHRLLAASLVVPEPSTATLLASGLAILALRRCSGPSRRRPAS